jgi:LmbE family N-acetylglucosaminyl deacetylase
MKSWKTQTGKVGLMILVSMIFLHAGGQDKQEKCIMVFGAHADDVELIAGGTFARYISEGYKGVYVCVINNFAGCGIESIGGGTKPPPGITGPLFTVSDSPRSYPVGALETIQIRREEALRAAAVFNAIPIFLDFRQGYIWQGRKRCYFGSEEYHRYQPPGRQVVSLAELGSAGNVELLVDILGKYSPDIVITHTLGGDKHDHRNCAYIVYLAFRKAMEKGIEVGQLWMQPKGWLLENQTIAKVREDAIVRINITDYLDMKYKALNQHVSQNGGFGREYAMGIRTQPNEGIEEFIVVIDQGKNPRKK